MKKLKQSIRKEYPQVILYLDDLTSILSILDENWFENIEIETNKYSYNKDEITIIKPEEQIKEIRSTKPVYFSLSFENSRWAGKPTIYIWNNSALSLGISQEIGNILYSWKRSFFHLLTSPLIVWIFCNLIIYLFAFNLWQIKIPYIRYIFLIGILLTFLLLVWCAIISTTSIVKNNIFYYQNKNELPNFFVKNKDNLLTGCIIAIITFFLTKILW